MRLAPHDAAYPARLHDLPSPPEIECSRPLTMGAVLAVVGTRKPSKGARDFAFALASEAVRRGVIVASGGAEGIDAAAHEGALTAGGETWVVCPTGSRHCYPPGHVPLFQAIERGGGALVWPFPDGARATRGGFLKRNGVLAALCDAMVVVQAGVPSGSLHACSAALRLRRPAWVVAAPPWEPGFEGAAKALAQGARLLATPTEALDALLAHSSTPSPGAAAPAPCPTPDPKAREPRCEREQRLLSALGRDPVHRDALIERTGFGASELAALLLTLVWEDVVVEAPEGFFRLLRSS